MLLAFKREGNPAISNDVDGLEDIMLTEKIQSQDRDPRATD